MASELERELIALSERVANLEEAHRMALEDMGRVLAIVNDINPYDHGLENEEQLNRIRVILRAW